MGVVGGAHGCIAVLLLATMVPGKCSLAHHNSLCSAVIVHRRQCPPKAILDHPLVPGVEPREVVPSAAVCS